MFNFDTNLGRVYFLQHDSCHVPHKQRVFFIRIKWKYYKRQKEIPCIGVLAEIAKNTFVVIIKGY